ncbi:MAG: HNH endonuclease [Lachnospiraceae bacterium]|nr:HNH endonuclease [Lachnospiraceae bacterium]
MNREVKKILDINCIQEDSFMRALYQDIREMFLGEICTYMKAGREQEIRKIYYKTSDDILAAKRTVQKVCGKTLPDEDLVWLDKCIKAYFHKKSRRQPILEEERRHLWEKQRRCCAICNQPINFQNLHVDHIVPWDYVGDELEDNLQALCADCNERKSNHVAYAIRYLFMEKKGVS